jgi:hypothetical protein
MTKREVDQPSPREIETSASQSVMESLSGTLCDPRRDSGLRSHPGSPDLGVAPQVQHCEHGDDLVRGPKVNGVRESVQQRSVGITGHRGELEWSLENARERSIDIVEESCGETGSFVPVPSRGILEIGLSEWPNDEPAGHSRSVAAVELFAEALLNNLPAVTGGRIGFEVP